jgi:hypothetical protein
MNHNMRVASMRFCTKINSLLGSIAAGLFSVFGKSPVKPTADDFKRAEFKTSTQSLGIRFSERIRQVFRFKWIKPLNKTNNSRHCHSSSESKNSG